MNKVFIRGFIKEDKIELKEFKDGTIKLAKFTLKVSDWFNKSTYFFTCQAWGKVAELCCNKLEKNTNIIIEGMLKQNSWVDKYGKKKSQVIITVEKFEFGSVKPKGKEDDEYYNEADFINQIDEEAKTELAEEKAEEKEKSLVKGGTDGYQYEIEDDDDVPF